MVASCLIILMTDHTAIWLTIPLIWLAHVTVTGTELFESSASGSLQSELSDQSRLGDYQGVASVANILGIIWTPRAVRLPGDQAARHGLADHRGDRRGRRRRDPPVRPDGPAPPGGRLQRA
jgi:hypothetical protein